MGKVSSLSTLFAPGAPEPLKARREIENHIERLIAALDALDGDPDLEGDADFEPQGDDEPSLGWTVSQGYADSEDLELDESEGAF